MLPIATKIYAIVSIVNGLATLIMAIFVLAKTRRKLIDLIFVMTLISASGWCLCTGIGYLQTIGNKYLLWIQYNNRFAALIPAFFFHFIVLFCNYIDNKKRRKRIILNYLTASLIVILSFLLPGEWLPGVKTGKQFLFVPTFPGYLYVVYSLFFAITIIFACILLIKALRKSTGLLHEQLKFLYYGTLFGFIAGGSTFPNGFGFEIPWGNYGFILMPLTITYAVVSKRLFDIKVAFTRAGIFLVVYAFVLGIPFIILSHTGSGILATSLAVIVASAGPIVFRFLQRKAEAIVLARQRNYQRILLQAATTMVTEHNLLKLSRLIVYILKRTIDLKFTAIFVKDSRNKAYPLMAMRGTVNAEVRDTTFNEDHPFISYLKNNHEPFFSEEMPPDIKRSLNIPLEIRIILPAFAGDELLAFVFLGDKVSTESYTPEDIDVFKILSRQATLAIQNCVFFEESKESQERMFSAEKLASIGGMADGLAHQIKNRLNQFSLAGGELKLEIEDFVAKHDKLIGSDPELDKTFKYLKDISVSLLDNVKRTDGVIKGILDFAKVEKKEDFFAPFSLKEVADLSTNLLLVKHETASIPLSLKIEGEDSVLGVKSQLTEVIYNLLDNAYEATKEKKMLLKDKAAQDFTPAIELSLTHTNNHNEIRISDNGIGIKEEDKHKIFAPFFTTKTSYKSGSGIGVYVVKRIVEENHKGKIRFTSTYMQGTEFLIELPKNQ